MGNNKNERMLLLRHLGPGVRKAALPEKAAPFSSNDELLEAARQMLRARQALVAVETTFGSDEDEYLDALEEEDSWTRYWHRSLGMTGPSILISELCRKQRLSRTEREILVALVLNRLGLLEIEVRNCGEVIRLLGISGAETIKALRHISERGRLYKAGLISYDDLDEDPLEREVVVDPALVEAALHDSEVSGEGWPVKTEGELYRHLCGLTQALRKRSDEIESLAGGYGRSSDLYKISRKVNRRLRGLWQTLELHPGWKMNAMLEDENNGWRATRSESLILLALIGKELGHVDADNDLFKGAGLARAASDREENVHDLMKLLMSEGELVSRKLIQPCGGADDLVSDNPQSLAEVEYELTEKSLGVLGIEKRLVKKRAGEAVVREARVRLGQLVLSEKVKRALQMAAAQARNADVLTGEWGLREVIPYGRSVALLFSGPPGTGKTACAEALAHSLKKPILVADYSQVQNCFVGQTEKNIVKAFRQARANDAVLFWDEADAMFYDRDMAMRTWEVRDVNVLLQELERFDGVCVLATNRRISLDKALERRVSLKVEFERPDRAMRRKIWKKLLPGKMPLAKDVDIGRLSGADLSGGEIKNVVLNAARLALNRDRKGPVTHADFEQALRMEGAGGWSRKGGGRIGFEGRQMKRRGRACPDRM